MAAAPASDGAAAHGREGARSRGALLRFDVLLRFDALVHDASSHGKYCGAASIVELHSRSTQFGLAKLALTVRFGWLSGGIIRRRTTA